MISSELRQVGLAFIGMVLGTAATAQSTVTVAVAANFLSPAEELAERFSLREGSEVRIIPGSSGKHVSMILNSGPVDVFLSADKLRPDALSERGLVAQRSVYALGRLALYVPDSANSQSARDHLMSGDVRRVAVADPRLAPYGVAAFEVLETWGLTAELNDKLVIGDNIGQTFGFVATGNADAGFVAYSQILTLEPGRQAATVLIDVEDHAPIEQHAVLTLRGAKNPEAVAFFDLVTGDEGREIIIRHGYQVPEE